MAKKEFKPHMMYGDGKSKKANTYKEHLALKKKGWSHSKPKAAQGGIVGKGADFRPNHPMYQAQMDVSGWQTMEDGGYMNGPSHDEGGIDINVEGGEIIINKNKNNAAGKHEKDLLNLNNNPDDYEIVKKDSYEDGGYVYPTFDARKRGK